MKPYKQMANIVIEPINFSDNSSVGCQCPPKRIVKKVYENPESIKNWVNQRDKELNDKMERLFTQLEQEIQDISTGGYEGKALRREGAIKITSTSNANTIGLNIGETEKILSQSDSGIISSLNINFDKTTKILNILGINDQVVASCKIDIEGEGTIPSLIPEVTKIAEGSNTFLKFVYDNGESFKIPLIDFVSLTQDLDGNYKINGLTLPLGDYLKKNDAQTTYQPKGNYLTEHQHIKTINGQTIVGDGNIEIGGGSVVQVQSDWNQNNSTAVDYIKNKPNIISEFKTINGQSIIGSGNIEVGGGGSFDSSNYYTKAEIDAKGYQTDIKTINNQTITGKGNLNLNVLTDAQMVQIQKILELGISMDTNKNILTIQGKKYQLVEATYDVENIFYIGVVSTASKSDFANFTTEQLLTYAEELDVTKLETPNTVEKDVTTNMIYIMIPDTVAIDSILMGEPPLQTVWRNQEWKDPLIWKHPHTDITVNDKIYHVYGYRAVDMEQPNPTKFEFNLHKV